MRRLTRVKRYRKQITGLYATYKCLSLVMVLKRDTFLMIANHEESHVLLGDKQNNRINTLQSFAESFMRPVN